MKIASSGLRLFSLNDTHVIDTTKKEKQVKIRKCCKEKQIHRINLLGIYVNLSRTSLSSGIALTQLMITVTNWESEWDFFSVFLVSGVTSLWRNMQGRGVYREGFVQCFGCCDWFLEVNGNGYSVGGKGNQLYSHRAIQNTQVKQYISTFNLSKPSLWFDPT